MDVNPHTSTEFLNVKNEPWEQQDEKKPILRRVYRRGRRLKILTQAMLFCPPFMVRSDINKPYLKYRTLWTCRICTKILLTKDSAISHAAICKLAITKEEDVPITDLNNMAKNMCYPCKYCDRKMRRKVIWLKHLNEHETPDYDESKWGVDLPIENSKLPRPRRKVVSKQIKPEPDLLHSSTS